MSYVWCGNHACTATYRVLEFGVFLDQFESVDIPFEKAPAIKMSQLRYFLQTTNNPNIVKINATLIARDFLKHVTKVYSVVKQDTHESTASILNEITRVFIDGNKTILDLAEVVDQNIKFPGES